MKYFFAVSLIDHHPELYGWERLGEINDGNQGCCRSFLFYLLVVIVCRLE
jgi:hypothetical protein